MPIHTNSYGLLLFGTNVIYLHIMVRASINAQNLRVIFTLIHSKSYNSTLIHAIPVNQLPYYSLYIGDRDGTKDVFLEQC